MIQEKSAEMFHVEHFRPW